jgi:hypothetical protein
VIAAVAVLMAIAQLTLPGVAASSVRSRLAHDGDGVVVTVKAFPAVKLLWHDADDVDVTMTSYHATQGTIGSMLSEAGGVGTVKVAIGTFSSGLITAHDVVISKHGDRLTGHATLLDSDLQRATSGILSSVTPLGSANGQLLFRGTLLSSRQTLNLSVGPKSGRIVAATEGGSGLLGAVGGLLGGLLGPITVFSDPHVAVDSLTGEPVSNGLTVDLSATLQ